MRMMWRLAGTLALVVMAGRSEAYPLDPTKFPDLGSLAAAPTSSTV